MGQNIGKKSQLSKEEVSFLTGSTDLSEPEVKALFDQFYKTNPNGKLSRNDFRQIMQTCFPRTYKEELEDDIFRAYDVDNNNSIDFQEFLLAMFILSSGKSEDKLRHIFRMFDVNGDGDISLSELQTIVEHIYHLLPFEQQNSKDKISSLIMSEMDQNKDGKVTEEEFIMAFMQEQRFTTIVVNKLMSRYAASQFKINSNTN